MIPRTLFLSVLTLSSLTIHAMESTEEIDSSKYENPGQVLQVSTRNSTPAFQAAAVTVTKGLKRKRAQSDHSPMDRTTSTQEQKELLESSQERSLRESDFESQAEAVAAFEEGQNEMASVFVSRPVMPNSWFLERERKAYDSFLKSVEGVGMHGSRPSQANLDAMQKQRFSADQLKDFVPLFLTAMGEQLEMKIENIYKQQFSELTSQGKNSSEITKPTGRMSPPLRVTHYSFALQQQPTRVAPSVLYRHHPKPEAFTASDLGLEDGQQVIPSEPINDTQCLTVRSAPQSRQRVTRVIPSTPTGDDSQYWTVYSAML